MSESKRETKQVIVMRTKYPDGNGGVTGVRKGKLCAQAAHASMAVFFNRGEIENGKLVVDMTSAMMDWYEGQFGKIVVYVDTEEELLDVYQQAREAELPCALIKDSGRTEFHGQTTPTAVAVGPAYADEVDEVTGELPLM